MLVLGLWVNYNGVDRVAFHSRWTQGANVCHAVEFHLVRRRGPFESDLGEREEGREEGREEEWGEEVREEEMRCSV